MQCQCKRPALFQACPEPPHRPRRHPSTHPSLTAALHFSGSGHLTHTGTSLRSSTLRNKGPSTFKHKHATTYTDIQRRGHRDTHAHTSRKINKRKQAFRLVERRMRLQEKGSPAGKVESREEFTQRLGRVARNLPTKFIEDSIGDLAERSKKLYAAKKGLFQGGGRKKRRRPL